MGIVNSVFERYQSYRRFGSYVVLKDISDQEKRVNVEEKQVEFGVPEELEICSKCVKFNEEQDSKNVDDCAMCPKCVEFAKRNEIDQKSNKIVGGGDDSDSPNEDVKSENNPEKSYVRFDIFEDDTDESDDMNFELSQNKPFTLEEMIQICSPAPPAWPKQDSYKTPGNYSLRAPPGVKMDFRKENEKYFPRGFGDNFVSSNNGYDQESLFFCSLY